MSLEAAAGKNPVSHVGKIYNVLARQVAAALISAIPDIVEAHCLIVSQIGAPISMPALVHVKLVTRDEVALDGLRCRVEELVSDHLGRIRDLVSELVRGAVAVF